MWTISGRSWKRLSAVYRCEQYQDSARKGWVVYTDVNNSRAHLERARRCMLNVNDTRAYLKRAQWCMLDVNDTRAYPAADRSRQWVDADSTAGDDATLPTLTATLVVGLTTRTTARNVARVAWTHACQTNTSKYVKIRQKVVTREVTARIGVRVACATRLLGHDLSLVLEWQIVSRKHLYNKHDKCSRKQSHEKWQSATLSEWH